MIPREIKKYPRFLSAAARRPSRHAWTVALFASLVVFLNPAFGETGNATGSWIVPIGAFYGLSEKSPSPFDLAVRYEHGEGVRQDYARAAALYCEAASAGDVRAFVNLGWMYANGRGVPRDGTIAVGWWRKAAAQGIAEAANLLRLVSTTPAATALGCAQPRADSIALAGPAPAEIRAMVQSMASRQGLDAKLVMAVIAAESAFNSQAVSKKNAKGLMQLMPETAARFGVQDPFDPAENIRGGTTYLRWLLQRFSG